MRSKSQILSKLRADGHITDEEYKMLKQEPKTGHWIDIYKGNTKTVIALRCSLCGNSPKYAVRSDFCPKCGAKMVEPQESEDNE